VTNKKDKMKECESNKLDIQLICSSIACACVYSYL